MVHIDQGKVRNLALLDHQVEHFFDLDAVDLAVYYVEFLEIVWHFFEENWLQLLY